MKIIGLDKLEKKLNEISNIDITDAIRIGALRVERSAKEIVPVDTGNLRNSITTSIKGNTGYVGTNVEYAPKVEFGIGQRAQPYLTPAFLENKDRIMQDIKEAARKQLKEITK